MSGPPDEFAWIESLRALTHGDPRALDLLDDAAVLPSRPGFDLVVSKDALVEGVHFLQHEAPGIVAQRLIRTSLSDLAAKAALPFGYFLMTAWPADRDEAWRAAFARGLAQDGETFGIALLGGDTVSTPGPLVVSATVLGWVEAGQAVLRSGAHVGDRLVVCGAIGDGLLGLDAARGRLADPGGVLAGRYRLPEPRLDLRLALLGHARAAADVSDGLLADAGRIALASGIGVRVDLGGVPLSAEGRAWLSAAGDEAVARLHLATGGDDYAVACAVAPDQVALFLGEVRALGRPAADAGEFVDAPGVTARYAGAPVAVDRLGWTH